MPAKPRRKCQFSGLENQGSTCYLNSTLQTLLFTPEFRDALFLLPENELGNLEDKLSKARVIPIQLQRLFVRLLLVDSEAISTTELTSSFGWTDNEEVQHQDVQELNKILFSAIQKSLVGTSGHNLISQLYHGAISSQVTCSQCNTSSPKTEDFLDLTVITVGHKSLQESLKATFEARESLSGKNQYYCDCCSKFVNAEKRDKIVSLPPIMTFSLLRFRYDSDEGIRVKETGKFSYPLELDMQPYCDKDMGDDSKYELFSVIVHSGNCYGGHYQAFIRDIDELGCWNFAEEPSTKIQSYGFQISNPVSLVTSLLMKQPLKRLHIDSLFKELTRSGISKQTFSPFTKFLMKNCNIFFYDKETKFVYVKNDELRTNGYESNSTTNQHWFRFDDNRVNAVHFIREMESQFSGNESAYMLFYRRASLVRPDKANGNPTFCIPKPLLELACRENMELAEERKKFAEDFHTITVHVHFSPNYHVRDGALNPKVEQPVDVAVIIDSRKSVTELRARIYELVPDMCGGQNFKLHAAFEHAAGMHLYNEYTEIEKSLCDNGIVDGRHLFVWDGLKVGGEAILTGEQWTPILLKISCITLCGNTFFINHGFPKSSMLRELKELLSKMTVLIPPITISHLAFTKSDSSNKQTYTPFKNKDTDTLEALGLADNDQLLAQETLPVVKNEKQVFVYNKTKEFKSVKDLHCPRQYFAVDKDVTLATIKKSAHEKFLIEDSVCNYRLRRVNTDGIWKAPLHEHFQAEEILPETISYLILEEGISLKENEITLMLSIGKFSGRHPDCCLNVNKSLTLLQCLRDFVKCCGLEGDGWHLCKCSWFGDVQEPLSKEEMTITAAGLRHGDFLLLLQGRFAPPGFMSFPVWFCNTLDNFKTVETADSKTAELRAMYRTFCEDLQEKLCVASPSAVFIGDVEISSELTLLDLKRLITTLPHLADVFLPSFRHLRLRLWNGGRPGIVLKNNNTTVKKLRLENCQPLCVQLLHYEEDLKENDVLLQVQQRIPKTSRYHPARELVWTASNSSHVASLRLILSEVTGIPDQHLVMAKHHPAQHSWNIIPSTTNEKIKKKMMKNLKHWLRDGDVIGVKNKQFDPENKDDFRTEVERELWFIERSQNKDGLANNFDFKSSKSEVGIKIHVDDFT